MAAVEWVSLYLAVARLENLWGIPFGIAEQIVRNVVQSGKVAVRGIPSFQHVYQIITERRGSFLAANTLSAADYTDIEIDWHGLVVYGRELIPSWLLIIEPATRHKRGPRWKHEAHAKPRRAKPSGPKRGPAGGTTGFKTHDRELFPLMRELMANGEARSAHGAAMMLAKRGRIKGVGTIENKAKRLSTLFLKEHAETNY